MKKLILAFWFLPLFLFSQDKITGSNENSTMDVQCSFGVVTNYIDSATCRWSADGEAQIKAFGPAVDFPWKFTWTAVIGGGSHPNSVTGGTTSTATGLQAGTYIVHVTGASGCTEDHFVIIPQPDDIIATSLFVADTCGNGNGFAVISNVTGGNGGYTYSWSNGQTDLTATGLTPGAYDVTITDKKGCKKNISDTIETLQVAFDNSGDKCFAGNTFTFTSTGTIPGVTYSWDFGGASNPGTSTLSNPTVSYNTPGSYTVTLVATQGTCNKSTNLLVNVFPDPVVAVSAQTNVMCYGNSTGSITVTASSGTPGYNYNWSNGSFGATDNNLSAGIYTVTVTDIHGCTDTKSITITQPPSELAAAIDAISNVNCYGQLTGSVTVAASGGTTGYTYSWSNGVTDGINSNLASGSYSVIVTDANGCTKVQYVSVTQPSSPLSTAIVNVADVDCYGNNTGSASVVTNGGTPGYSYSWSNGISSAVNGGIPSGTYTVVVTDLNGCTSTQSVAITQPSAVLDASIAGSTNVICYGSSTGTAVVNASGGTTPYSYSWSNGGGTNSSSSSLTAGTSTVTVTDAHGCKITAIVNLTQPTDIVYAAPNVTDAHCTQSDGSATVGVSGGVSPYIYTWSTGQTGTTITGVAAGTYTVQVTDNNGCTKVSYVDVNNINGPALTISGQDNVKCFGNATGLASVNVSGGTPGYSYSWNNGETDNSISGLASGVYQVTVTDAAGCKVNKTINITQPASKANVNIDATTNVACYGGTGSAISFGYGGTPGYTYSWSNGITSSIATSLTPGTYTVTVTDANGCTGSKSTTIIQPAAPLVAALGSSTAVLCHGQNTGSATVNASGGTTNYTYSWSNGAITQTVNNIAAGTYTVIVNDAHGCTNSTTITITQPATAVGASISSITDVYCYGNNTGSATINAVGGTLGYSYSWSNGVTDNSADNLSAGAYQITITDASGCTKVMAVNISQPAVPISAGISSVSDIKCYGAATGDATAAGNGGNPSYSYSWSNGQTTDVATGLAVGSYTVLVTDSKGCTATTIASVSQPAVPLQASFDANQVSGANPLPVTFTNTSTGADSYVWNFGDSLSFSTTVDAAYTYNSIGVYIVTLIATTNLGCADTAYKIINVHEPINVQVPNVFTPNGDGTNDVFAVKLSGIIELDAFIYDRWGLLMYEWHDPKGGWDGRTMAGLQAVDGTYYCIIHLKDAEGISKTLNGYLQLIR